MRFVNSVAARTCAALLATGMTVLWAADASAWSRFRDEIYADSFGNLVIQSPNGYKRIIVGQGHRARQLSRYERAGEPSVVYLDDTDTYYGDGGCYRPPYVWKGRSRMYGLPDGVVPQPPCADER